MSHHTSQPAEYLEVTGTGVASATPDVVRLDLGVHVTKPSVAQAMVGADAAMRTLVDACRAEGGPDGVVLHTTGAGVHEDPLESDTPRRYTARQSLTCRVSDRQLAGELTSTLSRAVGDALTIHHIGFEIADPEPLAERAREAAFADARRIAEQYAALAGRELGRVVLVTDSTTGAEGPPHLLAKMRAGGMPLEAGESSVTASVTVRWEWA
ncbi:SIMPL domain-containing protein [Janibacter sp. G1551]|uniref:SIMPL domain-containing protein n=1 Tax=Janibacter sp. G1551 TaxID=3420440 RepID=UPI003D094882